MGQLLMRRLSLDDLPPLPAPEPGLTLRRARSSDEPRLAELLRAAFQDDRWTVERVRRGLTQASDVAATLVLDNGSELLATASARLLPKVFPGSGYVHWVAASPQHPGRRLGYLVSLAVLHEFTHLGCRDAVLETDDFRLAAVRTYLNLGFEPVYPDEAHRARWEEIERQLQAQGR